MNVSQKSLVVAAMLGSLAGCMSLSDGTQSNPDEPGDLSELAMQPNGTDASLYSVPMHFQLLSDYTEQMAAELQQDLANITIKDKIVVASFVHLDASLRSTSSLGNQLAEFFIQDLQEIGLPVSEHRLADALTMSEAGDFVLTRNKKELPFGNGRLPHGLDIGYVLLGTLVDNHRGLVVNARLVDTRSQKVVAASSRLLPKAIFSGL